MNRVRQIAITLLLISIALPTHSMFVDWKDEFQENFQVKGIDDAVIGALRRGVTPDNIMVIGLEFDELNPKELVKAMYCAGIMGEDINYAGDRQDLAESVIVSGYKKAVEECREKMGYSLLFAPTLNSGASISQDDFVTN